MVVGPADRDLKDGVQPVELGVAGTCIRRHMGSSVPSRTTFNW
jgi:hypothetical protein